MNNAIITVAITGSHPTREMNPNLPISPKEIADSAIECRDAGASIAHIHVREPDTGTRSMKFEYYEEVVERIRAKSDMIINLTTGPGGQLIVGEDNRMIPEESIIESAEVRVEHVLKLKPEMCSLDVGSSNFGKMVFLNAEPVVDAMAAKMKEAGVKPEVEIFELGQIKIAQRLLKLGLIERKAHVQLCMGTGGGIPATPKHAVTMVEELPEEVTWSIFGVGRTQFPMVAMGAMLGGHVRVGMEDNLYMRRGVLAESNAKLVEQAAQIIRSLGRDVASVEDARNVLKL